MKSALGCRTRRPSPNRSRPGPVGEYVEVVDVDLPAACLYDPVDTWTILFSWPATGTGRRSAARNFTSRWCMRSPLKTLPPN